MNTRIRNKKRIMGLEEKIRQTEQNLAAVISEQTRINKLTSQSYEETFKIVNQYFEDVYKNQVNIILEFNKDIELIKKYQFEHMKEFHPNAHKSLFRKLMGGR